ncbi:hypothetical protein SAMN03080615_03566 [Amphritea atlantica]|uniref:Uncharacterized protein n=1 Tax=Amphritea atlantica TaxID=355243 RepID=A0A1H9KNW5_9GAMM|nr:hypothetical protein [Amphritea atlantica]SER00778.1 hypothetical protein SAMN03080615_03566 [Amphritea atlantica]
MNLWMNPWLGMFKPPFSGDLTQDISPVTSWWSPQIEVNFAGNRQIETAVVRDVASYGKQLGVITDVLLELTKHQTSESIDQLQKIAEDIEQVKRQHLSANINSLKSSLMTLKAEDPDKFNQLIKEIS